MSSSTSENKKTDKVEDFSCSSEVEAVVEAAAAAIGGVSCNQKQQQQQQQKKLNNFDNSKKSSTSAAKTPTKTSNTFGDSESEEKTVEPTVDSGYISGPISSSLDSNILSEKSQEEKEQKHQQQQQQQQQPEQNFNISPKEQQDFCLDSGCIEEEEEEEEEIDAEEKAENQEATAEASGITTEDKSEKQSTTDEMRLKYNVDSGISERFCNLSVQSGDGQSAQVTINNLNAAGRRNKQPQDQGQQLQHNTPHAELGQTATAATTATATTTANTAANITPQNAWQIFYQQNDEGDTPLHLSCGLGDEKIVMALIRMVPHPVLFNIQNDLGQTPLHMAALAQKPTILRMLLIAGAEPTIRDRHGNTALHLACECGDLQCVNALTIPISSSEINSAHRLYGHRTNDRAMSLLKCAQLPSDMEIRNYDGERCVHLAAEGGFIDVLRALVDHGADINSREGKAGRSPLHIAIDTGNDELASFLLDECLKINLETETYAGLTAYQTASKQNKCHLKDLLEKHGAESISPPDSDYDSSGGDSDYEGDHDEAKSYDRFGDPGYFASYNGGSPMTVI